MIVYSQKGCGKCMILKKMLDEKGLPYETVMDNKEVMKVAELIGVQELPILNIEGSFFSGTEALLKIKQEY